MNLEELTRFWIFLLFHDAVMLLSWMHVLGLLVKARAL